MENNVEELQQPDQIELMKALTIFRIVVISFFLGILVIFQMNFGEVMYPFTISALAASAYLVSIIYLLLIKTVSKYTSFISFQLATDIVIETAIIYYAGGIASPFTFLYMFTIISSAIVLLRPATYIVASIASIIYGVIALLELYGLINPVVLYSQSSVHLSQEFTFFLILSHLAAFFLIAYLSDILSQKVKKTFIALLTARKDLTSLQVEVERNERLASVGRIAAGLAHEIRNPLGAISGSIQMLQGGTGDEESNKKLMAITLKETDRLNRIINNLLSLTSQTLTIRKNINLSEILLESVELFKNDAKYKKSIAVINNLDKSITIDGDDEALKQVFWNTLLNSAQAMADGGEITVNLKICGEKMDGKEFCELSFVDTGCGIPEADLEKIFEPFYTTKEKGTGLGLSTAHKIIKNHSGNIKVKSGRGGGTSFIIELPISN